MNLSDLSKLDYTEAQFDSILEFVSQIKNAKIDDIDNRTSITLADLRPDTVRKSLPRELVLQNAPHSDGVYFIVPKVVE